MGTILAGTIKTHYVGEEAPYRIKFTGATSVSSPAVVAVYDEDDADISSTVFPTGSASVEDTVYVKTPTLKTVDAYSGQGLLIVVSATVDGRTQYGAARVAIKDIEDVSP